MITTIIRDIAIIVIAVQSIVIGVLIAILIWQVWRLVKTLQNEIKPIIQETRETINTVKGTTTFVTDNIVNPVAKTSGYFAGARQTLKVLASPLGNSTKSRATRSRATKGSSAKDISAEGDSKGKSKNKK